MTVVLPRFKLDENLPNAAALPLREAGCDVETVLSEQLGGAADTRVLDACRTEGRELVTLDLDFADIRTYPPSGHHGIWVLRPRHQTIGSIVELLRGALRLIAAEGYDARLWVVEKERVRIRE
jgi:predicted nuclease of predicted toxin-antitoxin system